MDGILREGKVDCECGNIFEFQSIKSEIQCMQCGKLHPNNGQIITLDNENEEV